MRPGSTVVRWTQADDDALEGGLLDGLGAEDLARRLNRSVVAVWHRASQLQVTRRSIDAVWLELFEAGFTNEGAAARMGVKVSAAWNAKWRLRLAGFTLPRQSRKGPVAA